MVTTIRRSGQKDDSVERRVRILHLAAEPLDRKLVQPMLVPGESFAELDNVSSLPDFRRALERGGYALILSDLNVPEPERQEALRLASERCPDVPFVLGSPPPEEMPAPNPAETRSPRSAEDYRLAAEELQAIMGAAPTGLMVAHDPQCYYMTGNAPAHEVLGVPSGENISATPDGQERSPFFCLYHEGREFRSDELPMQRACARGVVVRDVEQEVVRRDGTRRCILVNAAPLYGTDGAIRGAVGALVDITDRKRAEAQLEESEARLRLAVDTAELGTYERNLVTNEVVLNAKCRELLGATDGRPLPGNVAHRVVHPEDRRRVFAAAARALNPVLRENCAAEFRLLRPDGTLRWVAGRGRVVFDDTVHPARPLKFLGVLQDITERKGAEQALRQREAWLAQAKSDLEQRVEERTGELRRTMAEMEQISYSMVHDLRAPLRAVESFGCILAAEAGQKLSPEACELLGKMRAAAKRMDLLVRDVLNYSKMVREPLPLRPVDLGTLVRGIVETYPDFQSPKAEVNLVQPLPLVLGNESALTQCFSQLLHNAVKFTKPNCRPQVRIWAQWAPAAGAASRGATDRAQSAWDSAAPWVRVMVEDNGIGIEPQLQDKLFGVFQQLQRSPEGTGMGLAIVKKAAERMGGRVGVDSQPGAGSRFWLELRACPDAESP